MKNRIHFLFPLLLCVFAVFPVWSQQQYTKLPTLYLTTDNGLDPYSKKIYQPGRIIVKSAIASEELDMGMEIRGRGNSTWNSDKKPYRIKLNKKYNLLNNAAKAKSWVLLANDFDKTLIRNAVAMKVSELVGMEFTPSVRFVDVVLNGKYIGNYMLTDQVEVRENRVPVEEQEAGVLTEPEITGGYLIEIDGFAGDDPNWFRTKKGMPVTIKYPKDEEFALAHYNYIVDFTQRFEDALFSENFTDPEKGYRALVDEESLINWYIACELTGNSDSFWSTYMYKFRGEDKFYIGPLWDFDIAFNNDSRLGDATGKLMREHAHEPKTWIKQVWKDDWFKKEVYNRWMEILENDALNILLNYVDETALLIYDSQKLNEEKWHRVNGDYMAQVDKLRTYLQQRVAFLTSSFESDVPVPPSGPFVPDNFYYMIMNVGSGNIIDVADSSRESGAVLQLMNPSAEDKGSQQWEFRYIKGLPDDMFQVINKNSGLAMAGNGKSENLIQIYPDDEDDNQVWQVVPVLSGDKYGIVNMKSGYSVNNSGGSTSEGTPVIEYDKRLEESQNQQWFLMKRDELRTTAIPEMENKGNVFHIWQHPSAEHLTFRLETTGDIRVTLTGIDGARVFEKKIKKEENKTEYMIPISGITSGLYIIKINTGEDKYVRKIYIKNK
ncbi:MAG: CotH kinase family protein [Candidatus Azobacteroides sp.]|nr:CotH kinase family protein [Candidatus Azobacteroides sp.]